MSTPERVENGTRKAKDTVRAKKRKWEFAFAVDFWTYLLENIDDLGLRVHGRAIVAALALSVYQVLKPGNENKAGGRVRSIEASMK